MIQKLLERFGYVKKDALTEELLGYLYAKKLGDIGEYSIEPKQEKELFDKLKKVEGFADYLRATSAKDIQRYFMAIGDTHRSEVKGAFSRTLHLKNKLTGKEHTETVTKLKGLRYS